MASRGKASGARADLQRHQVGEEAERQRQGEERRSAVAPITDSSRLKVIGSISVFSGTDQLEPHQQELDQREHQERERGADEHPADVLVVGAGRQLEPARAGRGDAVGDQLGALRRRVCGRRSLLLALALDGPPAATWPWTTACASWMSAACCVSQASYSGR